MAQAEDRRDLFDYRYAEGVHWLGQSALILSTCLVPVAGPSHFHNHLIGKTTDDNASPPSFVAVTRDHLAVKVSQRGDLEATVDRYAGTSDGVVFSCVVRR